MCCNTGLSKGIPMSRSQLIKSYQIICSSQHIYLVISNMFYQYLPPCRRRQKKLPSASGLEITYRNPPLGPLFTNVRFTLIATWISNHISNIVNDEITYPSPNFNGCNRWSLAMGKSFQPILNDGCNVFSILGAKLIIINKRDHWVGVYQTQLQ